MCFRVRNLSGNHTVGPVTNSVSRKGTDLLSASFTVSSSVQLISVWVHAQNLLGSAVSFPINYTLSDIGKTAAVGVWWVCEVHGNFCSESVLCFMCNDTTQLFVSHEITMMLWMELKTSFAVKGVLLLYSKLEVYDKWWLSLMANNDVMESYLFKRCKFFLGGGFSFILTAMPSTPDLGQPDCSSRECIIQVKQSVRTQNLEIQYRAEAQTWTSYPDSVRRHNSSDCSRKFRDFQWDVARGTEGYSKPLSLQDLLI